jgi:hypothetical protein
MSQNVSHIILYLTHGGGEVENEPKCVTYYLIQAALNIWGLLSAVSLICCQKTASFKGSVLQIKHYNSLQKQFRNTLSNILRTYQLRITMETFMWNFTKNNVNKIFFLFGIIYICYVILSGTVKIYTSTIMMRQNVGI